MQTPSLCFSFIALFKDRVTIEGIKDAWVITEKDSFF